MGGGFDSGGQRFHELGVALDAWVEVEVDAPAELGVLEAEVAVDGGGCEVRGGGGLFITCHFTRSRVAMESSKDE